MTDRINIDTIVHWMARHGRPGYANSIREAEAVRNEIIGEAGPNWHCCPFVKEQLDHIDAEIADIKQAAFDRYQDWATD